MNAQAQYIRLYKAADEILRQPGNPCNITSNGNGTFNCAYYKNSKYLCCDGCKHLGPEGCTVMSLSCKLGWCFIASDAINKMDVNDHPVFQAIAALREEAKKLGLAFYFRASFKEYFGCASRFASSTRFS